VFVCVARRDHQQGPSGFTFTETEEDDTDFRLVDSRATNRPRTNKTRPRGGNRPGGGGFRMYSSSYTPQRTGQPVRGRQPYNRGGFQQRGGGRGGQGGRSGGYQSYGARRMGDSRRFDASINVNPEWGDPVETWEFSKLTKLRETVQYPSEDSEVLLECGKVGFFNYDFAKSVSTKQPKTLARNFATEKTFLKVTSSEDPNLRRFASEGAGNVFMTDAMLSALMAMPRALYSWDLVITKSGDQIWFDRRTSKFDAITVNENSSEPPDNTETDPLNTPSRLSAEAVACQQNFSQQVLVKDKTHSLPFTSPFSTDSNASTLAPIGYRYVSMPVGDKYTVIVRADIDAVKLDKDGQVENMSVKTLNEYDAKVTGDWRKKMEVQRGGVLATELKNNMFKIQRWALQALFAGCNTIEIGYLSRQQPKDAVVHHILSVQSYSPQEFFTGMSINLNQMWSIVELVLDRISSEDDGKYLLYKEAAVPNVKLYKIPSTSVVATESTPEAAAATGGLQVLK